MTKAPISLQDLRRSLYVKAKVEPTWRFWGLYVHICKMDTLHEAYQMAKRNDGAPGIDGVTFAAIEESGVDGFLQQILDELVTHTYRPMRARKKEIPKDGGKKVRVLSIPAIRDRVVQGAVKLTLEPIFEADFQPGSYGYRPKRTAHEAVNRVAQAIVEEKTRIIDIDLRAYFDNVQHYLLLEKVAQRIQDDEVMHLRKIILKANGEKGVPQGGVITPLTVANLARAFLQAGADSVVSTLWPVNDLPSAYLMKRFYKYLADGKSAADGLALAKRDILHDSGTDISPQSWAGFVLLGNGDAALRSTQRATARASRQSSSKESAE
jgi:retron-type reverse transcriptase